MQKERKGHAYFNGRRREKDKNEFYLLNETTADPVVFSQIALHLRRICGTIWCDCSQNYTYIAKTFQVYFMN